MMRKNLAYRINLRIQIDLETEVGGQWGKSNSYGQNGVLYSLKGNLCLFEKARPISAISGNRRVWWHQFELDSLQHPKNRRWCVCSRMATNAGTGPKRSAWISPHLRNPKRNEVDQGRRTQPETCKYEFLSWKKTPACDEIFMREIHGLTLE
mmetsp:Transcript_28150/g.28540  ORF Transcript_28150/g.28540 Transcript_28150/m.28540 type:complete len:152 (+) Transcript_28150:813-1268(+)